MATQGETHLSPFPWPLSTPHPAVAGANEKADGHTESTAAVIGAATSPSSSRGNKKCRSRGERLNSNRGLF